MVLLQLIIGCAIAIMELQFRKILESTALLKVEQGVKQKTQRVLLVIKNCDLQFLQVWSSFQQRNHYIGNFIEFTVAVKVENPQLLQILSNLSFNFIGSDLSGSFQNLIFEISNGLPTRAIHYYPKNFNIGVNSQKFEIVRP